MDNLRFRRQFLFTATKCTELLNWNIENLGTHYLYTHPDSEVARVSRENLDLVLIGHIVNPRLSKSTNLDILKELSSFSTIEDVSDKLYSLVGRFVLLIKQEEKYTFFHDPCGLKMIFYTQYNNELYCASQPLLLKLVTDIKKSKRYEEYYTSEYVKSNIEHWIPSGVSLYEDVYHLVPNHYIQSIDVKQVRYWPKKQLKKEKLDKSVENLANLLKQTMLATNKRYDLALTLTAGWDSRIILSSCKEIKDEIWTYTQKYRNLNAESSDIKTPQLLAKKLNFKHRVIDCSKKCDQEFSKIYNNNTDIPHLHDWGQIAYGLHKDYPKDKISVKGNCSEVGRCAYFPTGKHTKINSSNDFLILESQWEDIEFIQERVQEWFEEVKSPNVHLGYDLYDLFFWEHRMGSWQAQSQLEWDIVQETFTPFNNRELCDIMLSVDPLKRQYSNSILFKKTMEKLWKEALSEPINPLTKKQKIKNFMKKTLVKMGIFDKLKSKITKN